MKSTNEKVIESKQKDTIYIHSTELKELNTNLADIKSELHFNLEKEKSLLGIAPDIIFAPGIPVLVFAIGIWLDRRYKRIDKESEINDLKNIFKTILINLSETIIPHLLNKHKDYSVNYIRKLQIPKPLTASPLFTINEILELETISLYKKEQDLPYSSIRKALFEIKEELISIENHYKLFLKQLNSLTASIEQRYQLCTNYHTNTIEELHNHLKHHNVDHEDKKMFDAFIHHFSNIKYDSIASKHPETKLAEIKDYCESLKNVCDNNNGISLTSKDRLNRELTNILKEFLGATKILSGLIKVYESSSQKIEKLLPTLKQKKEESHRSRT